LHQLARRQLGAHFLGGHRLAVHRAEPAQPHQRRYAARVVALARKLAVVLHRMWVDAIKFDADKASGCVRVAA
jgi:hypothetical protein